MKDEDFIESIVEIFAGITKIKMDHPLIKELLIDKIQPPTQALLTQYSKSLLAKARVQKPEGVISHKKGRKPKHTPQVACSACGIVLEPDKIVIKKNGDESRYYCEKCSEE